MDERLPKRLWIAIIALLALAAVLTLALSIYWWVEPWVPVVAFVVLGVGPVLASTAFSSLIFDPTKTSDAIVSSDAPPLGRRLRLALAPVCIGALIFGALVSTWFVSDVRAEVVRSVAAQRMLETTERALADRDADVRRAACENGAALAAGALSSRMVALLEDDDEDVVECAVAALPTVDHGGAPDIVTHAAQSWYSELMTQPDPERACRLAQRLRVADRAGVATATSRLMQCALAAETQPSRECCAQSFRAAMGGSDVEPRMILPPPESLVDGGFLPHVSSLLFASHAQGPEAEEHRQALRLGSPTSSAWALAVGCEGLANGGAQWRDEISGEIAASVSSDRCRLAPATERTVRLWLAVCSEVFSPIAVEVADGTEPERFCRGVRGAIALDAVNEAKQTTHRAVRNAVQPDRRAAMLARLLDYSAYDADDSANAHRAAVEASRGDTGTMSSRAIVKRLEGMLGADEDPEMRKMLEAFVRGSEDDTADPREFAPVIPLPKRSP